ncbi:hypothetical protein [Flavobacterium sp. 25HG05S-40]
METLTITAICILIAILIGAAATLFGIWWLKLIHKNKDEERIQYRTYK